MMKSNEMNNRAVRRNTLRRCIAMLLAMVECFSLMTVGISASYAEETPTPSPSATMTDELHYVSDNNGKKIRPRGVRDDQDFVDEDSWRDTRETAGHQVQTAGEALLDYDEAFFEDAVPAGEALPDSVEEPVESPDQTDGEQLPEEAEEQEGILIEELRWDDAEWDGFEGTVTVTGEGLDGVTVETRDVSGDYADFDLRVFLEEDVAPMLLMEQDGAKSEFGGREVRTDYAVLTALDISLFRDGEQFQPEPEHPLAVTITDPSIREELELQLWHIRDDGTAERIEEFDVADNSLSFEAGGFSVYLVVQVTITTHITAGDGNTYRISVTYDQDADMPENAELAVRELDEAEKENYVNQSAEALGTDAESFTFARAFDISLIDPDTRAELQPAGGVKVSIRLLDTDVSEADELNLLHFGEEVETVDYTLNEDAIEFETDGFSVYVIAAAKVPYVDEADVEDLSELQNSRSGFYLSYDSSSRKYCTNELNGNSAFVEKTNISEASIWYFESTEGGYYIYTFIAGVKKYMRNSSGNLMALADSSNNATKFELAVASSDPVKFNIKVSGENKWLQHSNGGGGIRLYTDKNNEGNSQFFITYAEMGSDYYGLDGKTYSIAYNDGEGSGIGLTKTATAQSVQIDSNNITDADGTVARWTFTWSEGTNYTLSTIINGETKYLALNDTVPYISETPVPFTLNSNNGSFSFKAGNHYLGINENKFISSDEEAWLTLATLVDLAPNINWSEYSYDIKRNSTVTLDDIFSACGITGINIGSGDVVSMTASNTEILMVEGMTVKCLKIFTEPQTLTLTLADGKEGTIKVNLAGSVDLNLFLDSNTVYSYEGEAETHSVSVPAIVKEGDALNLTLSFSEIPEGQEGERQMKLSEPMKYTFPAGLTVSAVPETVTFNIQSGEQTISVTAAVSFNTETGVLTVTGDYGSQESVVSAATAVSFTIPVTVQVNTVPGDYELGNGLTLSAVKSHNVKVSSFTSGDYNAETGTIPYTAVVVAENDLDTDETEYPVTITDSSAGSVSGTFTYTHNETFVLPEGKSATQVNGADVVPGVETAFTGFPLTVEHMYEGDRITLTYTAKPQHGSYDRETQTATAENTFTITNSGNPSNDPDDDTASVTTPGVSCTPLTREYVTLDGSWAYWRVTVNPDGYTLNGGSPLTLADTFDDDYPTKEDPPAEEKTDAGQSIDYASVSVSADGVTYDYSGNTGTFVIPDGTPVTITYRTRITAQPGEAKNFRGTAVLKTGTYGEEIARATAGVTGDPVAIYPSASDVAGSGHYMVKLYVYAEKAMQQGIEGATFILLDANQRALEYKLGANAGQPVTFTTGSDGYANIELHEEAGDVSIEKNTGYYLEMMQAMEGYQKDNTLYSFMITDDPAYSTGGFYQYYNGDTMKVRLYTPTEGLRVSIRFSGSYALSEEQQNAVTAVLQKLDENDHWVEVESHPYTDSQWGAITFSEKLYDETLEYQNFYRVVEENESPWDLPEYINIVTTYYSMVNTDSSDPQKQPQEFTVTSAEDSVNVVIDNRYEDPQVTIVKMDKSTGEVLPGAVFTVYQIVDGEPSGEVVFDEGPPTTDENGEIVIRGSDKFQSETLYGIKETQAPELVDQDTQTTVHYLLPLNAEWHYFYFCNDEYLEPRILENLPAGATAINLTDNGDRITIDNQREKITVPVMKLWQGNNWPEDAEVVIGLYRSVEGVEGEEAVTYDDGTPRTVTLNKSIPYNNTFFKDLPSRDEQNRNYIYSIKEESINGEDPLDARYNQEYGISSAGVYIVRNKPATTLTVSKEWQDFNGNPATAAQIAAQSPVTFDVYRSSVPFTDSTPDDGVITNADMTAFVSTLTKVREKLSFGASDHWGMSIRNLDKQDDLGNRYYYYILETVPSFGNELYEVDEEIGTVKIINKIAPQTVNLTVTKAALVDDPRLESLDRDFEFTLKLQKDDTHPIRNWKVYTDAEHPENHLVTDWNGEAVFTLKPTNPDPAQQPTAGASITLSLPAGVTAAVTETYNAEYTVATNATVGGDTGDDGRTFSYVTDSGTADVTLTYTNTLHVICKVVKSGEGLTEEEKNIPFESLKSALKYIRENRGSFTAPWTIYMLEDYTIPATDVISVADRESLTLTTASTTDTLFPFKGGEEADRAVITRGGVGGSMLSNAGTLNLGNIVLDGGMTNNITAAGDGGLVYSSGTLNLNDKTTLRNSAASGKGGAVFVTGMTKTVGEEQTYVKGEINIVDGVEITGNSAPSASALYLNGILNMTGGSITGNTGATDGAVVVESTGDVINLSGSPVIFGNTYIQNNTTKAANLYIGADSDNIINIADITVDAHIGVSAMDGHMEIGEQFATAEFEKTDNLNRFVNDTYGYRGKLKDGTTTNIVWDGLTIKINKTVDPIGANANDRFSITLSSMSIVTSTYIIDGTLDYSVSAARQNRPGRIILNNVKNGDEITISPLPVGDYTIAESAFAESGSNDVPFNYAPVYTISETGSGATPTVIEGGSFDAENNSSITVTSTRRLANVKLTKTLDDRLKAEGETQSFDFTVTLTEADGTAVADFELADGITTNASGTASFTMSPMDGKDEDKFDVRSFIAPVGATMTITETNDPNYQITASAKTMPEAGEGASITDADTNNPNIFIFTVTDDGADVTFANVRKMAEIELRKNLTGKVSATESFTYTVTLTRADSQPAAGYVMYRDNEHPENNIVTDDHGQATIILEIGRDESTKAIPLTIPEGTKLEIAETEIKKNVGGSEQAIYTTKYSVNGAAEKSGLTATINKVSDDDHSIVFNNTRKTNTIVVKNTVSGYSGNVVPFTYTATVTDWASGDDKPEEYDDYDFIDPNSNNAIDFKDGVTTFELASGQTKTLTVPFGAMLNVAETFIVGYGTTIKRASINIGEELSDSFVVTTNIGSSSPLLFTNSQLIGLRIVNNTSSKLENVKITVGKNNIYLVNEDQTGQERISTNATATISVDAGKTAILEIQHDTSVTAEQNYSVKGVTPKAGYYYTLNNEPSFHETANPAILRVYDAANYEVKGKLRYSVADSTVTFTEQPLVSFDSNGGVWTTEMDGYRDRDGDRVVYQKAVNSGGAVKKPTPDPVYPTAEGVAFLGWTTDEGFAKAAHTEGEDVSDYLYDFDNDDTNKVTAPFTLYAIWARDPSVRTVTVKNGLNEAMTVTVTLLTANGDLVANYTLYEDITTDENGRASVTLTAGEAKNLHVLSGAKLVLSGANVYSAIFADDGSESGSFAIASVDRDGTVSLIGGVCKITDAAGNVLYDSNGKPAVYQTLNEALTKYKTALYTDASHTTEASQAAVKMLVDEYEIESAHTFPDYSAKYKDIILTTAGKDDPQYPYLGLKDRATLYRGSSFTGDSLFKITNAANVTFTNIILDGRNVSLGEVNGGLININKSNSTLTVGTGTTLQNVDSTSNASNVYGGAVYIENGTLMVNGGLFSNLGARQGGAIYAKSNALLNIEGTGIRFENCSTNASDGNGDGGAIYYNDSVNPLTINGGQNKDNPGIVFDSCVAKGKTGSGGAIYANTARNKSVSISGCSFTECSAREETNTNAAYGGGAICADGVSEMSVSYCSFTACDTLSRGGAVVVYIKEGETVSVSYSTFEKCNCKGQGGGLAVYQPNQESSRTDTRAKTKLSVNGCDFSNCSSGTNNGSGGAVQCYVPCMEFTNSTFTDCWAGKEGGAVNNYFGNGYTTMWDGSYLTLTGCTFIRCRAEDRFDPTALQHYGGGINTKVKTVTVKNSYFEDCVSTLKEGGALHIGGQGGGSTASITGSTFKNCTAKNGGGAVLSSHESLTIENSYFYGCGSSASNGGAVYHYRNSRGDSTQKNLTIKNSTFGVDPDDSESLGCIASGNGGAIWARATTSVTLEGLTINHCTAKNGGGIYLTDTAAAAKITGGAITNSTAESGSAVFVNKTATFSGDLSVSGNTVSTLNGGAIQTVDTGILYFEGNVKVENNTSSVDSENDHDVLMQINDNTIIYTTSVGLGSGAHIGVYVSDPNSAYANHGLYQQPFGTYHNSDAGSRFLDAFFNNRDSELYGYQGDDAYIHWGFYVCKITDADGNTLKRTNGRDAVYQQLSQAFGEFTSVKDENGETGKAVYIKMLVEDYAIRQEEAIYNFPATNPATDITLTTASTSDTKHPYRGAEGTVSTIYRTNSNNPLFNLGNVNAVFQLKDITLDGRKDKTAEAGDYKLITATAGEIVVNSGTTLQYAKGDNGAAIDGVTVTINGKYDAEKKEPTVKIAKCTATGSGGAISAQSLTITNADLNEEGKYGTSFMDCSAGGSGGAVSVSGSTMSITGALFQNCQSTTGEGGAVCHSNTGATASSVIDNSSFTSCTAALSGGAVSSQARTLTLTRSIFDNCRSQQNGGAISHTGATGTTITGSNFNGCLTETTDTDFGFGGSVYSKAAAVTLNGGEFKNSTSANHGGALYCANDAADSAATVSGTSFENCSTTHVDTCGGAIYSKTKALTLQSYTPEGGTTVNTTINACMALGRSGAVYMETSGSTLTVKDSTVISRCYADMGGAIYLPAGVTMNLTDSPEFTWNGYTSMNGSTVNALEGACIYLAEGSRINFKDSPKFSRNNITPYGENARERVTNGSITDFVRQDVYLAGYESGTPFDTNAASIYVVGELTGDTIWVWPEQSPHRLANEQFAKIDPSVTVSPESLSKFRNALADGVTHCERGEYLAGVQLEGNNKNVYWDKMYVVEFKKKDNKGVAVPDAGFTLYKDAACTQEVATAFSADGENDSDIQGKLLARGMVEFTSIRIGAYYMKESTVPRSFKENDAIYLVLVGTPYLNPNEDNKYLWEGDGPLNVANAATTVNIHVNASSRNFVIYPLDENNKAVLRANLASHNEGIENIRNDFQVRFMKMDGEGKEGKPLPGAAFTVYTQILDNEGNPTTYTDGYPKLIRWSRDGETYPAPVVSADGTAAFKDKDNRTLQKGMVYFRELPLGTYYLLETAYPERNGDGRRTYYHESDRVFKLELAEDPINPENVITTLSEWKPDDKTYEPLDTVSVNGTDYYVISNLEVVCKLTDAYNNLLYVEGHKVKEDNESDASPRLFPAIYATLEAGFADAQNRSFVYANGTAANVDAIKLKVLKDFNLSEPILYNSDRDITFTTAETRVSKDRYIFSTTRTTDTSRAMIRRAYNADTSADANAGALITLASGADMTLQNIRLNGDNTQYNGRAIHVTDGSSLNVGTSTRIEYFKQEAAADSAGESDIKGGAILMDNGTSLTIDGGYNRTAIFAYNEVNNNRTEGNTGSDGGAIAVGANCTFHITNAQFARNNAHAAAEKKGNGGAISINKTKDAEEQATLPVYNVVFSNNTASYKGGAIRTAENCNLTVSNCTFNTNYANRTSGSGGEGGAIAVLSDKENPSTLTITNGTTFTGNRAESGGAVKIGGYGTLTLENVTMRTNRAVNGNGGAVSVAPGAQATLTSGTISDNRATNYGGAFYVEGKREEDETVTSGSLTINGGSIATNTAKYGGAVFVAHGGKVTLTNGSITGNTATTYGGAFYVQANDGDRITSGSLIVSGGSVTENKASLGGAVYAANYAEVTITDVGITGNTATSNNGGAINVGGRYARLYFGGRPTVFDNIGAQGSNQQMNLVLSVNYNDVINTTADGLVDGVIGVYVIESNTIFERHGLPGKPFGTFGDSGHANPQVFRSDHALSLYGVTYKDVKDNKGENLIYWVDVICKLTDDNDKILYQDISLTINGKKENRKAQAVYARITDYNDPDAVANGFNALINGFNAAQGTLYVRDETQVSHTFSAYPNDTGTTVKLKMLMDYDLDKSIRYQGNRMVTFTTAETGETSKEWGDYFCYLTNSDGKALITRAFANDSMIVDEGTGLTLTKITLDGAKNSYSANVNGGIVRVENGAALTVTDGATLQNSITSENGGAVYVSPGATATVSGGAINGNTAAIGAGIYLAWDGADNHAILNLSGNPSFGGTDRKGGNGTDKDDLKGTEGNFVRKDNSFKTEQDKEPTNGSKPYPKDNAGYYLVRQDIYILNTAEPHNAIRVTGEITSGDGAIWIWAENVNHYEMLKQFAVFADGTREAIETADTNNGTDMLNKTYHAFRNARPDIQTNCGGDYLTGQKGEVVSNIYWTGGFDMVFLKIDGNGETLNGATFVLYKATDDGSAVLVENSKPVAYEQMNAGGVRAPAKASSGTVESTSPVTVKVSVTQNNTTIAEDRLLSGEGLAVFEKIPPSTYFLVEEKVVASGSDVTADYRSAEGKRIGQGDLTEQTKYKIVLNGDGTYAFFAKDGNAWTAAPTRIVSAKDKNDADTTMELPAILNESATAYKLILRKIGDAYTSLAGARFRLFRADLTEITDGQPSGKTYFESLSSGVFYVGTLPAGKYYLLETGDPTTPTGYSGNAGKVFVLTVTKEGYEQKELGKVSTDGTLLTDSGAVKQFSARNEEELVTAFKNWMKEKP